MRSAHRSSAARDQDGSGSDQGNRGSSVFKCKTSRIGPSGPWPSGGCARSSSRSLATPDSSPGSIGPTDSSLTSVIGTLGDHPGLVVDPFHRGTGLAGIKVVEDLRLPTVVCLEKRTEIQTQLAALTAKFPQPARGRDSVVRCIKDLLEPETNLVQRPQRRDLLQEGLQRLLLLGTQTLGIACAYRA